MSLTSKQEIFIGRLVEGFSQREAYRFAYNAENMKEETIDKRACELFAKGEIKGRYKELIEEHKQKSLWNRGIAEEKLLWLLEKSIEDIEYKGIKQANANSTLNTIKELNTLTDLYPKKVKEDINMEDREAEKIASALMELRNRNGTK